MLYLAARLFYHSLSNADIFLKSVSTVAYKVDQGRYFTQRRLMITERLVNQHAIQTGNRTAVRNCVYFVVIKETGHLANITPSVSTQCSFNYPCSPFLNSLCQKKDGGS
eukprot:GHVP01000026.1.p1 GENE.GHVP01000026.1~~GHVP01000026.1.p1  ORF type:complete len:109 (+),score=6.45 GHVP01000026.1:381-707(+)